MFPTGRDEEGPSSPAHWVMGLRAAFRAGRSQLLLDLGAALLTLVTLLISMALWRALMLSPLWIATAAVLVSVWLSGRRAGLISACISAVTLAFFFAYGRESLAIIVISVVELGVFLVIARVLADRLDRARAMLDQVEALRDEHHRAEEERVHLLARQESARAEAESARRQLAFLASASNKLGATLDYEATVSRLCAVATESGSDSCIVDLVQPDGSLHRAAGYSALPEKKPLIDGLLRFPPDPKGSDPVARALFTGQAEIARYADEADLGMYALDDEHRSLIRDLEIGPYMVLPLAGHGRIYGAVTLIRHRGAPPYNSDDLSFATDLVHRAALAIDNAYLYREAQAEIEERRRVERMLTEQQSRIEVLNERLQRAMVETHHRVKNNLQVIAAMVDMQTMDGNEAVSSGEIKRLGTQIRTLAAVHDILTQTAKSDSQAETVSAADILNRLLPMLAQTATNHLIASHIEDVPVPSRQGTALALIVNELVSNGIKHGRNQVEVLMALREGHAVLEVNDDGPGFPHGFDATTAANTGLELVENLSRWDLGGRTCYVTRAEGGARVTVDFPVSATAARREPIPSDGSGSSR